MRKELGKWFMDIAKYLLTGVLLTSIVSDLQETKWLIYVVGFFSTLISLGLGLVLLKKTEKSVKGKEE